MGKPKLKSGAELVITEEFIEIISKILTCFKGNIKKTRFWMITPNLHLGGTAPLKLIVMGRARKVLQFIDAAADEGGWAPREFEIRHVVTPEGGSAVSVYSGPAPARNEIIRVREISSEANDDIPYENRNRIHDGDPNP